MAEKLSEHFTYEEMIASDTAKIKKISNVPTATHKRTLKHTCEYLLEPLRALLNEKYKTYAGKKVKKAWVHINSAYRSFALNKAVGGVSNSQHCTGEATDLKVYIMFTDGTKKELPYNELYEDIKVFVRTGKLSVDQVIQEKSGLSKWVHVSYKAEGASRNRKQFLKYNNGKYTIDKI